MEGKKMLEVQKFLLFLFFPWREKGLLNQRLKAHKDTTIPPILMWHISFIYHQSIGKGTHTQLVNDTFQMHSWVDSSIILLTLKSARFTERYKRLEDPGISLCTLKHRDRIFYAGVKANTFIVVNTSVI